MGLQDSEISRYTLLLKLSYLFDTFHHFVSSRRTLLAVDPPLTTIRSGRKPLCNSGSIHSGTGGYCCYWDSERRRETKSNCFCALICRDHRRFLECFVPFCWWWWRIKVSSSLNRSIFTLWQPLHFCVSFWCWRLSGYRSLGLVTFRRVWGVTLLKDPRRQRGRSGIWYVCCDGSTGDKFGRGSCNKVVPAVTAYNTGSVSIYEQTLITENERGMALMQEVWTYP